MFTVIYTDEDQDVCKAYDVLHADTKDEAACYLRECRPNAIVVQVVDKLWPA